MKDQTGIRFGRSNVLPSTDAGLQALNDFNASVDMGTDSSETKRARERAQRLMKQYGGRR